ncbi:MAG: hypothetical protein ACR2PL_23355 [Dehalococcoidia bacterium]
MTKADLHCLVDALPDQIVAHLDQVGMVILAVSCVGEQLLAHEIDPEQAWFWTPEWQAKEREADEEIAAGRGAAYHSGEEFLAALEADLELLP